VILRYWEISGWDNYPKALRQKNQRFNDSFGRSPSEDAARLTFRNLPEYRPRKFSRMKCTSVTEQANHNAIQRDRRSANPPRKVAFKLGGNLTQ